MKFERLIDLRKLIGNICDNYVFDNDEYEKFNEILNEQVISVNAASEVTIKQLINEFGECKPSKD
ncbi:MAG: hypothetical protein GY804_04290 [Alphaproteobacteria bacterium]|nr:hypothetical protein [Alphaproteobacteria bacterium]